MQLNRPSGPYPLSSLRVVESALLGPGAVAMNLADLGADVIKVEAPGTGDYIRQMAFPIIDGISLLHCMTQSLARRGAGLGAAWGRERAAAMAAEAGFSSFEPLEDITNRFSAFYLLRP